MWQPQSEKRLAFVRSDSGLDVKTVVDCVKRKFQTVRDAQFVEHIVEMVLHRLLGDKHLLGDFLIFVPLSDQNDNFTLTLAKLRTFPWRLPVARAMSRSMSGR